MCLVLSVGGHRAPPGLGEPWRLLEIADVGLKRTPRAKVPSRHWVEKAMARASPAPWPGCPDAMTVVLEHGRPRAGWATCTWHVDAVVVLIVVEVIVVRIQYPPLETCVEAINLESTVSHKVVSSPLKVSSRIDAVGCS